MTLLPNFIDLVASQTGLNFQERDQALFRNRIQERIARHRGSEWDYYQLLQHQTPESGREWSALAALLTTGESYFFRDRLQFALLKNRILPELIKKSKRRRLRVWSAGCSSGEEPYSLAMLISELLPVRDHWQIQILGTDLNDKAIEQAQKGTYTEWSFRQTEPQLRKRFFSRRDDCWEIDPDIRAMVTFRRCNLVLDTFPAPSLELHDMDLIVCRNVFIYFQKEAVGQVVEKFADTLAWGGYLLTGHGELHLQSMQRLKSRMLDDQVILQKVEEVAQSAAPPANEAPPAVKPSPARPPAVKGKEQRPGAAVAPKSGPARAAEKPASAGTPPKDLEACLEQARSRADHGNYLDAVRMCRSAMETHALSPLPYFLLAQISEATGDAGSAKQCLKKAIYLDPNLIAAHLELGAMYLGEKNVLLAARSIQSARDLLQGIPPGSLVPLYQGTTAQELLRHAEDLLAGLSKKEKPGA